MPPPPLGGRRVIFLNKTAVRRSRRRDDRGGDFATSSGHTDMLNKCCAAWLILLVVSPFTAPFTVCELSAVTGRTIDRGDNVPANDLEEWFVNGGAMLDFPVAPAAGEFKLASLATLGTADFVEMTPAAPVDARPVLAIPIGRAPTLAVLRL